MSLEVSSRMKPITVIIAEDHVSVRTMMARLLESSGRYRILEHLSDGARVSDSCARLRPQLLILDVALPGLGGVEVAREVRTKSPGTHILIFTGHADPQTIHQAIEAGVNGMVDKSATIEEFERAVEVVALGREYFGESINQRIPISLNRNTAERPNERISVRESEILVLVTDGLSNQQMADRLGLSIKTVQNHRHRLMRKMGARNGADLARKAFDLGLIHRNPGPGS